MSIAFHNPSRSFDDDGHGITFWGYDGIHEISFFLNLDALRKLGPKTNSLKGEFLKVFDNTKERIYQAAEHVYMESRNPLSSYILTAENF